MLDEQTMRIVLGGVTLTVTLLFYLGVYRPTRSSFAGWWTLALLCAAISRSLLMLNGSELQVVTNPASIMLAAVGVTCVWFATRSLRREPLPLWLLGVAPVAILAVRILDDVYAVTWLGSGPLFIYMAAMFGAGATETWQAWRERRAIAAPQPNGEAVVALLVTAIAGGGFAAFYALRAATQMTSGTTGRYFELEGFSGADSVIVLVCLVAVTFSVAAVGWDQQTQVLRRRAMYDDLTGLLGRTEFRVQAERALKAEGSQGHSALVVVADLDHFKSINDVHGHAAGDEVLVAFASALRGALRPGEPGGRLGGEEFGMVLIGVDDADALARVDEVRTGFADSSGRFDFALPTVSYGAAGPADGESLAQIFERADLALYVAKAQGRDRTVRYTREIGEEAGRALGRRASDTRTAR